MGFGIIIGIDGKPICPCCRDSLWHCKRCWNKYHNGEKHQDYLTPDYYGQSMMGDDVIKIMKEKHNVPHNPSIKPDKKRKYDEGMYGHP